MFGPAEGHAGFPVPVIMFVPGPEFIVAAYARVQPSF
jgi:hypothetical protein